MRGLLRFLTANVQLDRQPADRVSMTCTYCAQDINPDAILCLACGRDVLQGCTRIAERGKRFTVGQLNDGRYGVWDGTTCVGAATQLKDAQRIYRRWEKKDAKRLRGTRPAALMLIGIILAGYWVLHTHKYENCVIKPSIVAWPSTCL